MGLVFFLTGANVGFIPAGNYLGTVLASLPYKWIIIPIGMIIGYFIVKAEPAVYVLMKQVEELTDGDISGKSMQISLSVGVAVSVGLSMLRVLCQISILYLLIPGYVVALILTRFVPKIFTAIANYGYNTQVMKAAQDGGAAGGTVLHGKGVGMKRPVLRVRQARSFSPFRSHLRQGSDLLKIFKI